MLKNTALLTIAKVTTAFVAFLLNWYLARTLDVDEFGAFSLFLTYTNFLGLTFILGMNISHVYYKNKGVDNSLPLILLYILISGIFAVSFLFFDKWFYFIVVSNAFLVAGMSILNADAQAHRNFKLLTKQILSFSLSSAFFIVIGTEFYGYSDSASIFLLAFLGNALCFSVISVYNLWGKKMTLKLSDTRGFIIYGINGFALNIMAQALYFIDIFIIGKLMDNKDVAFYVVASLVAKVIWLFIDAVGTILFPNIINGTYQNKLEKLNVAIRKTILICLAPATAFILWGDFFIELAFGSEYSDSYLIACILIIGAFPLILYKLSSRLIASEKRWKDAYLSLIIALLVNISLNLILIPEYGLTGAAVSSFIAYAICGAIIYVKVKY